MRLIESPSPKFVGRHTPGSARWQLAREHRIGGSEIAAIMGLSPFASRFSIFATKMGFAPLTVDDEADWGTRMEPAVWDRFVEGLADDDRLSWAYSPGSYAHGERDWQLATPDGMINIDGMLAELVEIKCPVRADLWGEPGTGQVPVYYRAQVLWNLDVFGLRRCWMPVKIGHSDYRLYVIDWDDEADDDLELMLGWGRSFISDLEAGNWPDPADGSAATYEILRESHPDIERGESVEIDSELAGDFMLAKAELDAVTARWNSARSRMALAMGRAQNAKIGDERVAFRTARRVGDGWGKPSVQVDQANYKRLKVGQTIKEALQCKPDSF